MGMYFGIINFTKHQIISSLNEEWKNDDWCNLHSVMHKFHWDHDDEIYIGCYCCYSSYAYDSATNKMYMYASSMGHVHDDHSYNERDYHCMAFIMKNNIMHTEDHVPQWNNSNLCTLCDYEYDATDLGICSKNFNWGFCLA